MGSSRTYFVVIMLLIFGGLAYATGYEVFSTVLNTLDLAYPSYFGGQGQTLLEQIMYWSILLVVLISTLLYVVTQSQKPEGGF